MTSPLFVLMVILVVIGTTEGFVCYTGDADILRRKTCPHFSDICFKKVPGRKYFEDSHF